MKQAVTMIRQSLKSIIWNFWNNEKCDNLFLTSVINDCVPYFCCCWQYSRCCEGFLRWRQANNSETFTSSNTACLTHTQRSLFQILSNRNQIVFTMHRLIWNSKRTMSACCYKSIFPNLKLVNTIWFQFDDYISKRFLCVHTNWEKHFTTIRESPSIFF